MSLIKDWKFEMGEGIFITEDTNFGEEIHQLVKDLKLPNNQLSLAKVHILQTNFTLCRFHWLGIIIELSTQHILGFNPFYRASGDDQRQDGGMQQAWYQLDGKEHCLTPLKKNLI